MNLKIGQLFLMDCLKHPESNHSSDCKDPCDPTSTKIFIEKLYSFWTLTQYKVLWKILLHFENEHFVVAANSSLLVLESSIK